MRVLIILCWIVSSTAWAGGIVRGKIRVVDEGPVDAFFITHTHASKMNPIPKQMISKDGSFEFEIDGPDYHWWVFAAPGYESVVLFPNVTREHDIIEFNIDLGRHQIQNDSIFTFHVKDRKPLTFIKQGNRLVHETKSTAPIVGVLYQGYWPLNVHSGGDVLNGYGGFEVRLVPKDGRYEIDLSDYPVRTGMRHERIIPVKNFTFNAAVNNMMDKYNYFKAKQGREGLRQLLGNYEKQFQGMDALHFRYIANRKLSRSLDKPLFPMDSFGELWEHVLANDSFAVSMYYAPYDAAKYKFGELNEKNVHGYADYCRRLGDLSPSPDRSAILYQEAGEALIKQRQYEAVEQLLATMRQQFANTYSLSSVEKAYASTRRIGQPAPPFELKNNVGSTVTLADFKGKYLLIDVWSISCPPCIQDLPKLAAIYPKLNPEKIAFLSVDLDGFNPMSERLMKKHNIPWTQAEIDQGWEAPFSVAYGIRFVPTYILIGPDGKILVQDNGKLSADHLVTTLKDLAPGVLKKE